MTIYKATSYELLLATSIAAIFAIIMMYTSVFLIPVGIALGIVCLISLFMVLSTGIRLESDSIIYSTYGRKKVVAYHDIASLTVYTGDKGKIQELKINKKDQSDVHINKLSMIKNAEKLLTELEGYSGVKATTIGYQEPEVYQAMADRQKLEKRGKIQKK